MHFLTPTGHGQLKHHLSEAGGRADTAHCSVPYLKGQVRACVVVAGQGGWCAGQMLGRFFGIRELSSGLLSVGLDGGWMGAEVVAGEAGWLDEFVLALAARGVTDRWVGQQRAWVRELLAFAGCRRGRWGRRMWMAGWLLPGPGARGRRPALRWLRLFTVSTSSLRPATVRRSRR